MSQVIDLTNLDFESIKGNLIEFLKNQTVLTDYDYDGDAMQVILDTLAYNTYMNAYYYNMVSNEAFLDTALIRSSVVSKAKELGYTPRSRQSAQATLFLTFNPNDNPTYISIPHGTTFKTTIDKRDYIFTTAQDYAATFNSLTGYYERQIDIFEGQYVNQTIIWNSTNPQRVYVVDPNVDINSIIVGVKPNISSSTVNPYARMNGILSIDGTSLVYWVQEDVNGLYEIYFGDGTLGRAMQNGEVVQITYRTSTASLTNGASSFVAIGNPGINPGAPSTTYPVQTINLIQQALYGAERESISSIKFNAPKSYSRQERVVTQPDYESYLSETFPEIESFSVWGGEKNSPPIYGRVYMCAKPVGGYLLSATRKQAIADSLQNYSMLTATPVVVDPLFTFINLNSTIYYNPSVTTSTSDQIFAEIVNTIQNFEITSLDKFKQSFLLSKLSTALDASDASIVNNTTTYRLEKRLAPIYNSSITYKMDFHNTLFLAQAGVTGCLSSTGFYLSGTADVLYLDDDGNGNVRIYNLVNNLKNYINTTAGTIDYVNGVVLLNSFIFSALPDGFSELSIFVNPVATFYNPLRNEILLFSYPRVTLYNTVLNQVQAINTVSVLGNSASVSTNYLNNPVMI